MKPILSNQRNRRRSRAAFSLVEIVIAMAIIATGMIAIVGLIPVGLQASRDAAVRTTTAIILEDIHDRLEGQVLDQDGLADPEAKVEANPFYYDDQGLFLPIPGASEQADIAAGGSADAQNSLDSLLFRRRFRVDVRIETVLPANKPQDSPTSNMGEAFGRDPDSVERVKAIIINLSWPVNPGTGEPMGNGNPKSSVTYYLTTLTGPEWEKIDPAYNPKIEF
jgi:uncharacterized protein (TIGR02598 family)